MGSKEIFNDLNLVVRINQHIQQVAGAAVAATHHPSSRNAPSTPPTSLPRQSSFKVLADLESVSTSDPRQGAQFEHQREGFASSASLPFHLQGDSELNEGSALARRRALRFSDALRDKIVFLWDVARGDKQASAVAGGSPQPAAAAAPSASPPSSSVEINAEDYMTLMLLIFKVLRDDFSLELARKQILCDWDVDSRHGQALAFEQFFSAMFELVDVWTCDVEEATYVRFLELLLRRVTVRVVVFLDGNTLKLALSDNFDEAVVVKAIPLSTISRFASVARIVAPRGVRTIGELASADPAMVEQQRVDYLRRNSVSSDKIGRDLQELLAMFRQLAQTFEHADYSLQDNMVLRRRSSVADGGGHDGGSAYGSQYDGGSGGRSAISGGDRGPLSTDLDASGGGTWPSSFQSPSFIARGPAWPLAAPATDVSCAGSSSTPVAGGRKRLNSIHDISVADPDLVMALKTSFLIEKRVSLEKQAESGAIREELAKFGVENARELGEEAARRQYATLYEMFVVRDGDNLKALAHAMLQHIKAELATHGIAVDDDADAEAAYDHFYGAVVAGTGETIVADAQQWVQHTIAAGAVGEYVKRDYHALKPVDEVALLGTQPGDEEFVALVAKDDNEDGAEAVNPMTRRQSSSPIQRKASQLSLGAKSFKRTLPEGQPPLPPATPTSDKRAHRPRRPSDKRVDDREGGEEDGEDAQRHGKERKGGKHKQSKRKKKHNADSRHVSERSGDELESSEAAATKHEGQRVDPLSQTNGASDHEVRGDDLNGGADGSNAALDRLASEADASPHTTDRSSDSNDENAVDSNQGEDQRRRSSASVAQVADVVLDDEDELSRRRSEVASRPSRAGPLESESTLGDAEGNHVDADDHNREPQGVDFEFEEAAPEPILDEPKLEPTRPVDLPPKVPEIVVGGVAGGTSTAVAGRYIQLLGLGSVTTTTDEASLFELLESDAGRDTDLVCFDVGTDLEAACEKLLTIQRLVGKCVILLGGVTSPDEPPSRLDAAVAECLAAGALYFATLPINFPQLREQIYGFFESSTRPYVLRSRKPMGRAAAAFQSATRTIGAAGLFVLQEAEPSRKLSMASAAVAHSGKGGLRKLTVSIPGMLPAIGMGSSTHRLSVKVAVAAEEARAPELTPSMPLTPRSLKSYKKSPRLSAALNKLIR